MVLGMLKKEEGKMKRSNWLAVALLVAVLFIVGCGSEKTIVVDGSEDLSIELLSPQGGEVVAEGGIFLVRWDIKAENLDYNESFDIYYYLVPQEGTGVRSGDGTYFDPIYGGYAIGGWAPVPQIGNSSTYLMMPVDLIEGAYKLKIVMSMHQQYGGYPQDVISIDESEAFTVKIDPVVFASDSDRSLNYNWFPLVNEITPQNYPDFFVAGVGKGIYIGSSGPLVFGQEPNPLEPKTTTDSFSTYYDHCASSTQLNEAFRTIDGKLAAIGIICPNGCSNGACIP